MVLPVDRWEYYLRQTRASGFIHRPHWRCFAVAERGLAFPWRVYDAPPELALGHAGGFSFRDGGTDLGQRVNPRPVSPIDRSCTIRAGLVTLTRPGGAGQEQRGQGLGEAQWWTRCFWRVSCCSWQSRALSIRLASRDVPDQSRPDSRNNDAPATHILASGALGCGGITRTRRNQCAFYARLGRNHNATTSCSAAAMPLHPEV